jgi:hypothetical protein
MSLLTSRRALAVLIAGSLPLAACGSSSSSSSAGTSGTNAAATTGYSKSLEFASCMRSHGVPNFPDPKLSDAGVLKVQSLGGNTQVNGVTVNGPAFQSAMQACKSDLPNGGKPQPLSESRRNAMLAFSQCMRRHGLPNFPDPTFNGGTAGLLIHAGSGINPQSPAFQAAQKACGSDLTKAGLQAPGPG